MTVIAMPRFLGGKVAKTLPTYKFEDSKKPATPITDLEVLASYCERAHADLEVHKAVLADAENHVVQCQGEVAKAEIFLEECQAEFVKASANRKGVPCPNMDGKC